MNTGDGEADYGSCIIQKVMRSSYLLPLASIAAGFHARPKALRVKACGSDQNRSRNEHARLGLKAFRIYRETENTGANDLS